MNHNHFSFDRRSFVKASGAALLGGLWSKSIFGAEEKKPLPDLPEGWHLRMGNAQTPAEAIAELEAFTKATPDWRAGRSAKPPFGKAFSKAHG